MSTNSSLPVRFLVEKEIKKNIYGYIKDEVTDKPTFKLQKMVLPPRKMRCANDKSYV